MERISVQCSQCFHPSRPPIPVPFGRTFQRKVCHPFQSNHNKMAISNEEIQSAGERQENRATG